MDSILWPGTHQPPPWFRRATTIRHHLLEEKETIVLGRDTAATKYHTLFNRVPLSSSQNFGRGRTVAASEDEITPHSAPR